MSIDSDPEPEMALLDIDEGGENEPQLDTTSRHVSEVPGMPDVPATTTVPVSGDDDDNDDDDDDDEVDHQGVTRSDDESDLSDIDEAQFENFDPANVAIDERTAGAVEVDLDESNIGLIGVHKRKRSDVEESGGKTKKKKQQQQQRKQEKPNKRFRKKDDGGNDGDGDFILTEELMSKRTRKAREPTSDDRESPRKKKKKGTKDKDVDDEQLSPEERRRKALDRRLDEALKSTSRRRRKLDGIELEKAADDLIEDVRQRMVTAARNDNQARTDGRMVTEKLKMLPDVVSLLNRSHLQDHIVDPDSGIIESMRFFLEPLSDGSLPAYDIQREIFTALLRLPLSSDTLIQSSIGKIVLFYNKSKVVQPEIKRMAERLLGDWTRPLMKRSDNYKHRTQETADFDVTKMPKTRQVEGVEDNIEETYKTARGLIRYPQDRNRARVQSGTVTYDVAPVNVGPIETKYARRLGERGDAWIRKFRARASGKVNRKL